MTELIVAVLGAAGAIVALRLFDKYKIDKFQKDLEKFGRESDKVQARLEGEQAQEDKETKEKVDEIEREKNNKPSLGGLADWFQRRK